MRLPLSLVLLAVIATAQDIVDLSILHFNDFHAALSPNSQGLGGAAHLATAVRRERANCPRCILLNAGDNVQGSPVSSIFRGLPVFEVLRPLRADAFVLGNHEFDYGYERINDFLAAAGQPVLSANFLNPQGKVFTETPSVIIERDGLRIGIVGVLMEDLVPSLTTPAKIGPNRLVPALDTLRAEAARLKDKTDILIALVHLWKEGCDQVVREIPDYAVTVSGHDHGGMQQPFAVDGRLGVRLRANGTELGRLDLRYDKTARKIVSSSWKKIRVSPAEFPADPEVAALVEKWEGKVKAVVDVPVGSSAAAKDRPQTRALIERVMREKTGADFVLMNQGGVRDILPAGALLERNLWNIMPFDNMLVVGKVPGRLIPDNVRGDRAVEPDQLYSFATIDFLIEGFRNGKDDRLKELGRLMPLEGPLLRDVLIEWVRAKRIVD
jgi:2',3'-cyclic-nucleotide 2'-phosphodiesterase (5'-nucleotidase family)